LEILYYNEPKSLENGVTNVACYLSRAIAKKANLTYFPQFSSRKGALSLFNVYREYVLRKFDIVHFNIVPTWINGSQIMLKSANRRKTPTVLNVHGLIQLEHVLEPTLGSLSSFALLDFLTACNLVDKIVVATEFLRTKVNAWYGINYDKIAVIPNGVDFREFNECERKLALEGDPAILNIGLIRKIKGFDILVEAIAKLRSELPDMKLHIVGHDPSNYSDLVKKRGIEKFVVFHGKVPHLMVPSYLKSADICVFPSRLEGFGIVILEAMASGVPIVASDIGSFREILSNGKYGMLFKSGNANALFEAILGLYQDQGRSKKVATAALEAVKAYSWENIAEKYISLYHSLLVGSSNTK